MILIRVCSWQFYSAVLITLVFCAPSNQFKVIETEFSLANLKMQLLLCHFVTVEKGEEYSRRFFSDISFFVNLKGVMLIPSRTCSLCLEDLSGCAWLSYGSYCDKMRPTHHPWRDQTDRLPKRLGISHVVSHHAHWP